MIFRKLHIVLIVLGFLFSGCSGLISPRGQHAKVMHFKKNSRDQRKKAARVESNDKLIVKTTTKWQIGDLFRSEQKQMELRCPTENSRKEKEKPTKFEATEGYESQSASPNVMIHRGNESIHFDIIKLSENRLDIPAFKQFQNNMTDFTAGGEKEFREIIHKIRDFLGDNTDGEGVTLHIIGSASQIPTSFDPSMPNNNIRADGSSIPGQTSIENNKMLAAARANELANKIKEVFANIEIVTPNASDIQLGETVWDWRAQQRLNKAVHKGNKADIQAVYEPYQKEQFVKVISQETQAKTVKPKSIKMYNVYMTPKVYFKDPTMQAFIDAQFVVSKRTYDLIGGSKSFDSVDERLKFLREHDFEIMYTKKDGVKRWYLLGTEEEKESITTENEYDRIFQQYELGLVDNLDKHVLQQIITEKYKKLDTEIVSN